MISESFKQRIQANTTHWLSVVRSVQDRAYAPLDPEWPNLRQSVQFALEHRDTRAGAAELWASLIGYVESRGFLGAWQPPADRIAADIETLPPELGCRVGNELGFFFRRIHDFPNALRMHTHALEVARRSGDRFEEGLAILGLGNVQQAQQRGEEADANVTAALELLEPLDPEGLHCASGRNLLGLIAQDRGDYLAAEAHHLAALAAYRKAGHARKAVSVLHNLSQAQRLGGDAGRAIETLASAEALLTPGEELVAWTNLHLALGTAHFERGNIAQAKRLFLKIDQPYLERHGLFEHLSWTTNNLGNVALVEKDWELARDYLGFSAGLSRRLGSDLALANTLGDLGTALSRLRETNAACAAMDEALALLKACPENAWARKRREAILTRREAVAA